MGLFNLLFPLWAQDYRRAVVRFIWLNQAWLTTSPLGAKRWRHRVGSVPAPVLRNRSREIYRGSNGGPLHSGLYGCC